MKNNPSNPPPTPITRGVVTNEVNTHRERDDNYKKVVLMFNDRWRLIICQQNIQWIVQRRESLHGGAWRGIRYVTQPSSLIEVCGELGLPTGDIVESINSSTLISRCNSFF